MRGRSLRLGCPVLAAPVGQVGGRCVGHALPPHVAVVGERGVGEDAVAAHRLHGVGVGLHARARGHPEEPGLGVDGVEASVGAELHPADVVPDGLHLPSRDGGDEHGQIGLAARRREGAGDVAHIAFGGGELEDEHVLGEPVVVAGHDRRDAQGEAFLPQQGVAAVARSVGPDLAGLGEMHDVLALGVTRPRHIRLARLERMSHRMQAGHELAVIAEHLEGVGSHARHDPHGHHDVGGVGDLDTDVRDGRAQWAHREGHHVHGAAPHRAFEQLVERGPHLVGVAPVVGGAGVVLVLGADEGAVLDARHVAGVRAGPEAVGPLGLRRAG